MNSQDTTCGEVHLLISPVMLGAEMECLITLITHMSWEHCLAWNLARRIMPDLFGNSFTKIEKSGARAAWVSSGVGP
jgi:hypothetical protein